MSDLSRLSPAERIARDPIARAELLERLKGNEGAALKLAHDWDGFLARPSQRIPPGKDWSIFGLVAGRGYGKTRTLAEFCRWAKDRYRRGSLVARTTADVRDVIVEGESGILAISPPGDRPKYEPAKRRLTWRNGATATLYSADAPDALRGPQCEWFAADELASWKIAPPKPGEAQARIREPEAWSNLMMGWRLGQRPVGCFATTPRPLKFLRELLARNDIFVVRGGTLENAQNLAPQFRRNVVDRYAGTRLGRQELEGEILEEIEGALWSLEMFDEYRLEAIDRRELARIVVSIDPAGTHKPGSDDTGLTVQGRGFDGRGYLLQDATCHLSPGGWGRRAVELYREYEADAIVAEVNNGGEMVAHTIHMIDPLVRVIQVRASRGKALRAEPIAALYEQGRISHVGAPDAYGVHPLKELEDQCTQMTKDGYQGEGSPDRLDAMVWGFTELFLGEAQFGGYGGEALVQPQMISPI